MKKIVLLALGLCLVAALSLPAQDKAGQIGKMLDYTGITQQLKDFNDTMAAVFDQQSAAFDSNTYTAVIAIIQDEFGAANFYRYVSDAFVADYNAALLAKTDAAYASKLFKDITAKEIADSGQAFEDKVTAFDYQTVNSAWDAALEKYVSVTNTVEWQTTLVKESLLSFFATYNLFLPKEKKIAPAVLDQIVAQSVAAIRSPDNLLDLKKRAALHYMGFSLQDFSVYTSFYDAPEGRWMMKNFMGGFNAGMKKAMQQAADRMKSQFGLDGGGA